MRRVRNEKGFFNEMRCRIGYASCSPAADVRFRGDGFQGFTLWHYPIYYAVAALSAASGYFLMCLRRSRHTPKTIFLVNTLIALTATVLVVLVAVVSSQINNVLGENGFNVFYFCVALMPSVIVWYLLGMSLKKNRFDDIFTPIWLGIYLVETFICYIFCCVMSRIWNISVLRNTESRFFLW